MAGGAPTPPAVAASAVGSAGARAAGSVAASGEGPRAGSVVVSVVGSAAPAVAAAAAAAHVSDPVDADGSDLRCTGALASWARAARSSCQHGPFAGEFYPGLTACTPGFR